MAGDSQFIDVEGGSYGGGADSYENIVIEQIGKCVRVLSKEEIMGMQRQKDNGTTAYTEDIREVIINSVETLRMLLFPFIGTKKEYGNVNEILKKIEEESTKISESKIKLNGKTLMVRDAQIPGNHPILLRYKDFKANQYRMMFGSLMIAWRKARMDIEAMGTE